ncbi:MAG: biotin transporter BioY, partial [Gemmatimonadota bacterium]
MTEPESIPSDAGQPALVLAPWVRVVAVLAGVLLMVLAGQITVPHLGSPVPMTLQSLAVIVIGGVAYR